MKRIILILIAVVVSMSSFAQRRDLGYSMKVYRDVYELTKNAIAKEMRKWQTQGEFERQVEYEQRIRVKSKQTFDSIVVAQMMNSMRRETDWYCYPIRYDVENGTFKIEFINEDVSIIDTIDIPMNVEFAKKVRMYTDEFDKRHPEWVYKAIESLVSVNYVEDWKDVMVFKGHFLYKRMNMVLKDKSVFLFDFPTLGAEPVVFYCDEMDLNNPILNGYSCEFAKVYDRWKKK